MSASVTTGREEALAVDGADDADDEDDEDGGEEEEEENAQRDTGAARHIGAACNRSTRRARGALNEDGEQDILQKRKQIE